jgi:hypothetical protein
VNSGRGIELAAKEGKRAGYTRKTTQALHRSSDGRDGDGESREGDQDCCCNAGMGMEQARQCGLYTTNHKEPRQVYKRSA